MLLQAWNTFQQQQGVDLRKEKLLLAISGGVDSMVLLDLTRKAGLNCGAAHVNFGLRGEDSRKDEALVTAECEKHGIPLHSYRPDTLQFADDNHLSVQMAARNLRYRFFKDCCNEQGYGYVATAHHAGDNLENFFIYLLRNNPLTALKGIAAVRDQFVRPLLPFSKEELIRYATENELAWRDDISNESDHYLRNRIRHHIIPGLKEHYPEAEQDFLHLSRDMTGILKQAENARAACLQSHRQQTENGELIQKTLLETGTGKSAFSEHLRSLGFSRSQTTSAMVAQKGARFTSHTHFLVVESRGFVIGEGNPEPGVYRLEVEDLQEPLNLAAGQFRICMEWVSEISNSDETDAWYFDSTAIHFPLTLRNWSQGDKMQPWGMEGHKKLSDLFTDLKTGLTEKPMFPVLESGGLILGVVGMRRSAAGAVNSASQRIFKITWRKR